MTPTCTVCTHVNRAEIDLVLLTRTVSLRDIAGQYGLSRSALDRHRRDHLARRMVETAATQAEADVRTALDVISQLREINTAARGVLTTALDTGDGALALQAVDRVQRQIELQAKLINLLDEHTAITVITSPAWVQVRTTIVAALNPFPEARIAVADALAAIEGGPSR